MPLFRVRPRVDAANLSAPASGGVEEGTITFEPCAELVDDWVVVSEADIAAAMVRVEAEHAICIEGGLSKCLMTRQGVSCWHVPATLRLHSVT